jgi:hypothetical protein
VDASFDFEMVTTIPKPGQYPVLVLGSAICLSEDEIACLETYLRAGGNVIAFGSTGVRDQRARLLPTPWVERYAIRMLVEEPERIPSFPPYIHQTELAARCTGFLDEARIGQADWVTVEVGAGRLYWSPGQVQSDAKEFNLAAKIASVLPEKSAHVLKMPSGWALRQFKDSEHIYLIGLPKKVVSIPHETLSDAFRKESIVERIEYLPLDTESLMIQFEHSPASIRVYSPDLSEPREVMRGGALVDKISTIDRSGICRFFVIQIKAA